MVRFSADHWKILMVIRAIREIQWMLSQSWYSNGSSRPDDNWARENCYSFHSSFDQSVTPAVWAAIWARWQCGFDIGHANRIVRRALPLDEVADERWIFALAVEDVWTEKARRIANLDRWINSEVHVGRFDRWWHRERSSRLKSMGMNINCPKASLTMVDVLRNFRDDFADQNDVPHFRWTMFNTSVNCIDQLHDGNGHRTNTKGEWNR